MRVPCLSSTVPCAVFFASQSKKIKTHKDGTNKNDEKKQGRITHDTTKYRPRHLTKFATCVRVQASRSVVGLRRLLSSQKKKWTHHLSSGAFLFILVLLLCAAGHALQCLATVAVRCPQSYPVPWDGLYKYQELECSEAF